ncbi:hypothetical protein GQ55_2G093400 [Panicum hallii var. hallii]|uniref:Uncharacterized protein n=1 Tax=Panicum hallii var. hallii TaxID=1504633 RepID=A0A2T7EN55_9POAL|nr:hypothetical protein GQ55_2G093400 [Panicum hallii var. hallii]
MEPPGRSSKRRRSDSGELEAGESSPVAAEATEVPNPHPATPPSPSSPPSDEGGGGGGGVDHISGLPDAILGEIIALLSTRDAARVQTLASRWRHIWRAAPLNLDSRELLDADEALAGAVSRILADHPGPGLRFCIPSHIVRDRPAAVDAWLRSPALDSLQELDFCLDRSCWSRRELPASTFRFAATLRVATFSELDLLDAKVEALHFPQLTHLALQDVSMAKGSLHTMISSSSCPVLECLLLDNCYGCRRLRISSNSLRSIAVGVDMHIGKPRLKEVTIVNAPCLERFLHIKIDEPVNVSVIVAPKLETLGCLNDEIDSSRLVFGTTVLQGFLVVSLTTVVRSVKILALKSLYIKLDTVIGLMKCFPCLEKLYIKSCITGRAANRWRRKHRDFIKCSDIHLKTIVLEQYRGIRSQVNFASFFLLNARELELMTLELESQDYSEEFVAEQHGMLQMEKRASRGARLHFTGKGCQRFLMHVKHIRDLSITDPFECRCYN